MDNCREEKKFIKIFDEKIAMSLADSGFSYMKETINGNQEVFIFEESEAFMNEVNKYMTFGEGEDGGDVLLVEDTTMCF